MAAILDRATGGRPLHPSEAGGAFDERWAEFEEARRGAIPRALERLHTGTHPIPPWVDARGIFRYVHPLDGDARARAQRQTCDEARKRVLAGEDFGEVAAELSQGGTRKLGGVLGRRYLRSESTPDQILGALGAGEVSPVIEVSNGCWIYRVDATGEATALSIDEAPWIVRRILLRRALSEQWSGPDGSAVAPSRPEAGADT